jgi:hypothetical protein
MIRDWILIIAVGVLAVCVEGAVFGRTYRVRVVNECAEKQRTSPDAPRSLLCQTVP